MKEKKKRKMNREEELFQKSLDALVQEIQDALLDFNEDNRLRELYDNWINERQKVLHSIMKLVKKLKRNKRNNNAIQFGSSTVSAVGGIGFIVGLVTATAIAAPIAAVGFAMTAAGGLVGLASNVKKGFSDYNRIKKTERALELDSKKLQELLIAVKEYMDRIQVLRRKINTLLEEIEKSKLVFLSANIASGIIRKRNLAKSFQLMKRVFWNLEKPLSFYDKASKAIRSSAIYGFFFKSSKVGAVTGVGGKAAAMAGQKLFVLAGIALDIVTMIESGKKLTANETPQVAQDFEKLLHNLIEEQIAISHCFQNVLNAKIIRD